MHSPGIAAVLTEKAIYELDFDRLPAVREKLVDLRRFHVVDAVKNVGEVFDRVETIALCRSDQRRVYCKSLSTCVRAGEKEVFPRDNKRFDLPFAGVVVDFDLWILEESRQCFPMLQCVARRLVKQMAWREVSQILSVILSEFFHQSLGVSSAKCQSCFVAQASCFPLDFVQFVVDVEHSVSNYYVHHSGVKNPPSRMSIAACFGCAFVTEHGVEACGRISLNDAFEAIEKLFVLGKGQLLRIDETDELVHLVAAADEQFSFSHVSPILAILNFHVSFIGLNNCGLKNLAFQQFIQRLKRNGQGDEPIALCGTRNWKEFSCKHFFLPVIRQTVFNFVRDDCRKQAWTCVASWYRLRGFRRFCDVEFALWTSSSFLVMVNPLQRMKQVFKLSCHCVADNLGFHFALWADLLLIGHLMRNDFTRKLVFFRNNIVRIVIALPAMIRRGMCWSRIASFVNKQFWKCA